MADLPKGLSASKIIIGIIIPIKTTTFFLTLACGKSEAK